MSDNNGNPITEKDLRAALIRNDEWTARMTTGGGQPARPSTAPGPIETIHTTEMRRHARLMQSPPSDNGHGR